MEEWKDIPGYEGRYQINRAGLVRSLFGPRGKRWNPKIKTPTWYNGFRVIYLCVDHVGKRFRVDELIGQVFNDAKTQPEEAKPVHRGEQNSTPPLEAPTTGSNGIRNIATNIAQSLSVELRLTQDQVLEAYRVVFTSLLATIA